MPGTSATPGTTIAPSTASYPIEPEELGSGTVKWAEEKTKDGWMQVTNEGGETLGYSADSGVALIQIEGLAFKDLNRNGKLDAYEDWRLDDEARAVDLASQLSAEEIIPLMLHGGWMSFGGTIDGTDLEYIQAGGRAGVTRSAANEGNTVMAVTWTNALQALCESTGIFGIPATISTDPVNVSGVIDQNALASTMDSEMVHEIAVEAAKQYRAVGVTMLLGPQIDIATSPVWSRTSGTYSEDPALNRDLAAAYIDGLQSTYDESGSDLGWGKDSVVAIAKHFVGIGAGEGGRNDHQATGKYTVFPGNNFNAHLVPFFDGAFNLAGATETAGGLMPNYGISYSDDESLGELVGGAYSEFKMNLLRDNGYDGFILTDWQITNDNATNHGVEDLTVAERFCALFKLGNDQIGGTSDVVGATSGYELLVEDMGEDAALAQIREAARRFFTTQMEVGLYENAYISKEGAAAAIYTDETNAFGLSTQERSIIMLKNSENIIHAKDEAAEKATVYVPAVYIARMAFTMVNGVPSMGYNYSCEAAMDLDMVSKYYNVVTDTIGEPSGTDEQGNPKYMPEDIVRASTEEIASCDYALVCMTAPMVDSAYDAATGTWAPASIQYEAYTADSAAVRKESIAGDTILVEGTNAYGTYTSEEKENRSYFGNTSTQASSYSDYETLKYVKSVAPADCKIVVLMAAQASMVWSEVEPLADAILLYYGVPSFNGKWFKDEALLNVLSGAVEPSGLLPLQQPASMEAVEAQLEDVPRDAECYVDANGNTYDFAFGMNWTGVISDERTSTYSVPALTTPETVVVE